MKNTHFNMKALQKERRVDSFQKIKKTLSTSHEKMQFFKRRASK